MAELWKIESLVTWSPRSQVSEIAVPKIWALRCDTEQEKTLEALHLLTSLPATSCTNASWKRELRPGRRANPRSAQRILPHEQRADAYTTEEIEKLYGRSFASRYTMDEAAKFFVFLYRFRYFLIALGYFNIFCLFFLIDRLWAFSITPLSCCLLQVVPRYSLRHLGSRQYIAATFFNLQTCCALHSVGYAFITDILADSSQEMPAFRESA